MKKHNKIICGILALTLCIGGAALIGCNDTDEKPNPPVETVTFSETTNPHTDVAFDAYPQLTDWTKKMTEIDEIYYQFDGAYVDGSSCKFLYMNCYKDGLLHATYDGTSNYYGYWTNIDRRQNQSLVLHIVSVDGKEYNNGINESVCEQITHNYYEYSSTVVFLIGGKTARTVFINGKHYSPVKSLSVSGGKTSYTVGESWTGAELGITVTSEDGKSTVIDEKSLEQADCRVKFDGFDSSKPETNQKVTVTYKNTNVSTTYNINVSAAEYSGKGKFDDKSVNDVKVRLTTSTTCEVLFNGKTATVDCVIEDVLNNMVCTLKKPVGDMGITDDEWSKLHKQYVLNIADYTFTTLSFYRYADCPSSAVYGRFGDNAKFRDQYIIIDDENMSVQLAYTLLATVPCPVTYVCEYSIDGNILTLTACTTANVGNLKGLGESFEKIYKQWQLDNDNFTATKYIPEA